MKNMALVFSLLLISAHAFGQKQIDWKPCQDMQASLRAQIEKFNAEHRTGAQLELHCLYGGDPDRTQLPKMQIPLAPKEIETLHSLRADSNAAFAAEAAYEDHLIRAHHIRKPDLGEECYYFVGLVLDTDYITVDPNPMSPTCTQPVHWKAGE